MTTQKDTQITFSSGPIALQYSLDCNKQHLTLSYHFLLYNSILSVYCELARNRHPTEWQLITRQLIEDNELYIFATFLNKLNFMTVFACYDQLHVISVTLIKLLIRRIKLVILVITPFVILQSL